MLKTVRPQQDELTEFVKIFPEKGASALEILEYFLMIGYQEREIQSAIQSALNSGALKLGKRLWLYDASQEN